MKFAVQGQLAGLQLGAPPVMSGRIGKGILMMDMVRFAGRKPGLGAGEAA